MSFLARLLGRSSAPRNGVRNPHFLSTSQLLAAIEAEQSRTGRTGSPFCVVRFVPEAHQAPHVAEVMARERRHTDALGWSQDGRPTALLVATAIDGAEVYGERIRSLTRLELPFEVEAYPHSSRKPRPVETDVGTREAVASAVASRSALAVGGGTLLYAPPKPLWKAILDRTVAAIVLALMSPLFALVAAWIKAVSPGPVFFRQERVGRAGNRFVMWKFRSLVVDSSCHHREHVTSLIRGGGELRKIDYELPLIPGGRLLRASCIDELPQLINVVLGHMSLVGPRPLPSYEADEFFPWQAERHRADPGLTGLWQVSGKNRLTFEEMIRLDIRYGRQRTLGRDMMIVARTFPVLLESVKGGLASREPKASRTT